MRLSKMHLHLHCRFCFKAHWQWLFILLCRKCLEKLAKIYGCNLEHIECALGNQITKQKRHCVSTCRGVCICVLADAGCPGISWVLRRWFSKLLRPDVSSSFTPASRLSSEIPAIEGCEERGHRCYLLHFPININISAFSADCRSTTAHSQLSLVPNFCASLSNDLMVIGRDAALCISGIPHVTMCHNSGDYPSLATVFK